MPQRDTLDGDFSLRRKKVVKMMSGVPKRFRSGIHREEA